MRRLFKRVIPLLAIALIISCGGNSTGPDNSDSGSGSGGDNGGSDNSESTTGTVEITTSTSGNNQDSDGYTVSIADSEQSIGINETITIADLDEGSYDAELTGIADNCSMDGNNPKTVDVTVGETTSKTFNVSCETKQSKILFTRFESDSYVFSVLPDGSEPQRIPERGAYGPVSSPSGNKFAFSSRKDGNPEVYIYDLQSENVSRVTNNSGKDYVTDWSPDGSRLLITSDRDGDNEIYSVKPNGDDLQQLTDNSVRESEAVWSPDGSKIAFTRDTDDHYGEDTIFTMNADGSSLGRVTENSDYNQSPSWSPDGSRIAFTSTRTGDDEIYTIKPDGSDIQNITKQVEEDCTNPAWSPGGNKIAFELETPSDRDTDIYTMDPDGSNLNQITDTEAVEDAGRVISDSSPDWLH